MKDLAQALQPLMIRGAVDSFRGGGPPSCASPAYLVGLALLKGVFQYWMRVILIGISRDIEFDLRNDLFAHLIRLSPEFYGAHAHRRHHGARHQRSQRRAHDAGPGRDVLVRNQPDLHAGHRHHDARRLAPGDVRGSAGARSSAWP